MVYTKLPQGSGVELRHGFDWEFSLQPLGLLPSIQGHSLNSKNPSNEYILAADSTGKAARSLSTWSRTLRHKSGKLHRLIAWLRRLHGWQKGVFLSCMAAGSILVFNTILVIAAYTHYDQRLGAGTLYHGNCDHVRYTSTALHLLINIVSTALLAASSYTMQCLSAPTRLDVDKAHKKRKTLYIGILSIKNMLRIGKKKAGLWCFLGLSTLPLHLLWNSVIASKISSNDFLYLVVEDTFLADGAYSAPLSNNTYTLTARVVESIRASYHAGNLTRHNVADCISVYGEPYVAKARNLLAITTPVNGSTRMSPTQAFANLSSPAGNASNMSSLQQPLWNGSSLIAFEYQFGGVYGDLEWLCKGYIDFVEDYFHQYCSKNRALQYLKNEGSWSLRPDDPNFDTRNQSVYEIEYCLIEDKIQQHCTLQYVPAFLATVTVCNLIKFICMLFTCQLLLKDSQPILATVGDAIASFVDQPDVDSKDMCMLGFSNQKAVLKQWKTGSTAPLAYVRSGRGTRLFSATGKRRSFLTIVIGLVYTMIGVLLLLLVISIDRNRGLTLYQTLNAGLGAADKDHIWIGSLDIYEDNVSLASQVFYANIWQVALAVVYFMLNSLLTAQAAALEWVSYSQAYRPLRVTFPEGEQKSTWFLQLPLKTAIPLITTLTLIHWLISQAIFVLFVEGYGTDGNRDASQDFLGLGYSPVAILCVVCLSGALLLVVMIHGLRPLSISMPLHGHSSLIISATCHPTARNRGQHQAVRDHISRGLLRWGAVEEDEELHADINTVGHCSFDSDNVFEPVIGKRYM